jgi:hypothetical protein
VHHAGRRFPDRPSEGGLVTLRQLVLHATRHLTHHVRFIEEKRHALAAASNTTPKAPE